MHEVRALAGPGAPLILTAGGSMFFNKVVGAIKPAIADDPRHSSCEAA